MAVWRCRAEVDHHDALRQTGDSGTSLQVGYIALRTGLQDWDLALMHHCHKRAYFNGISESSPGAVALCYGHSIWVDASEPHRLLDHCLLCWTVGSRQACTSAVLVGCCADERTNTLFFIALVALVQLHENASATFTALVTIGTAVEGEAAALMRKHCGHAVAYEGSRSQQGVYTHNQSFSIVRLGWVRVEHAQMRSIHRDQGGRARGVIRRNWPTDIKLVGNACSCGCTAHAQAHHCGAYVRTKPCPLRLKAVPVGPYITKPKTHAPALQAVLVEARSNQALVADLHGHLLAWNH
mmetsp:Transcript_61524/g.144073  ORF Transcript_61524/g.144073 Transcript_61524/m.144073 type:complete len:296 (+) Transcript_61524:833-1720(+)